MKSVQVEGQEQFWQAVEASMTKISQTTWWKKFILTKSKNLAMMAKPAVNRPKLLPLLIETSLAVNFISIGCKWGMIKNN